MMMMNDDEIDNSLINNKYSRNIDILLLFTK